MIREVIVTTLCEDGKVHIAPMGVAVEDANLVIAPFRPSTTLDNLSARRCAVINYTDDVRVFAGCLTGRRDWPTRPATSIAGAVLDGALAHAELEVVRFDDDDTRPRFHCRIAQAETHAPFRGFNRAQAAVVEAAILVSRLEMLPMEKIEREIAYLEIAVSKTAGPDEHEAWGWLMARLSEFKRGTVKGGHA